MVGYFCVLVFRLVTRLGIVITKDKDEAMQNAGVSILCVITLAKAFVCMSSDALKLIDTVKELEIKFSTTPQREIVEIYDSHRKLNRIVAVAFFVSCLSVIVALDISPVGKQYFIGYSDIRPLPISVYLPFDTQKFYKIAYSIHILDGIYGCLYTSGINTFFVSLMIFAVCQIKILNYSIRNLSPEHLYEIIREHLFIIKYKQTFFLSCMVCMRSLFFRYVTDLNDLMKTLMFLDFAMCSMHLAVLAFVVVVVN